MATEIQIRTAIETSQATTAVEELEESLSKLIELQKQVGEGSENFDRLQQAISQTAIRTADSSRSMEDLRKSLTRLVEMQGRVSQESEEFRRLQQAITQTQTRIDNLTIHTDRSNQSFGELRRSLRDLISLQSRIGQDSEQFANLQQAINETEGRIGDLTDSFGTLRGSGVERVNSSLDLLRQGFANADTGQLRIGLQGLGAAMSALPIFLLIEGIKFLIQNFEKIVEFVRDLTDGFSTQERELRQLKRAYEGQRVASENLVKQYQNEMKVLEALNAKQSEVDMKRREANSQDAINAQKELDLRKKELEYEESRSSFYEGFLKSLYGYGAISEAALNARQERLQPLVNAVEEAEQKLKDLQTNAAVTEINIIEQKLDKIEDLEHEAAEARLQNFRENRQQEISIENEANKYLIEQLNRRLREDKDNSAYYQSLIASQLEAHRINLANIDQKYYEIELRRRNKIELDFYTSIKDTYAQIQKGREEDLQIAQLQNEKRIISDQEYIGILQGLREQDLNNLEANQDYILTTSENYELKRLQIQKKYDDLLKTARQKASQDSFDNFNASIERGIAEFAKFQALILQLNMLNFSKRVEILNKQRKEDLETLEKNKDLILATGRSEGEARLEIERKYNQLILSERLKVAAQYVSIAQNSTAILNSISQLQTQNENYETNQRQYTKDAAIENDRNRTTEAVDLETQRTNKVLNNDNLTSEQRERIQYDSETRKNKIEQDSANAQLQLQNSFDRASTEIKKKQFERDKKLRLASAIIATAAAVVNGLATVPFVPSGIAAGIAAGALGGIQIAAIASSKFDDGGAGARGSVVSARPIDTRGGLNSGSGGAYPSSAGNAPTFNPKAIGFGNQNPTDGINTGPEKVYVLEGDIRNVIGKVNVFETRSTFGD